MEHLNTHISTTLSKLTAYARQLSKLAFKQKGLILAFSAILALSFALYVSAETAVKQKAEIAGLTSALEETLPYVQLSQVQEGYIEDLELQITDLEMTLSNTESLVEEIQVYLMDLERNVAILEDIESRIN